MKSVTFTILLVVTGCAEAPDGIEVETSQAQLEVAPIAEQVYFQVRRDVRLCPAPLCGGFLVRGVNQKLTVCADGRPAPECHVAAADWSRLGLSAEELEAFLAELLAGRGLVRGAMSPRPFPPRNIPAILVASEGWRAATAKPPTGLFVRLTDLGIVCITQPCFSFHEQVLNSIKQTDVSRVDLSGSGASKRQVLDAFAELSRSGLLAAGENKVEPIALRPDGLAFVASQFYTAVHGRVPR